MRPVVREFIKYFPFIDKYNELIFNIASNLFNAEIYESLLKGTHLDALIWSEVSDQKNIVQYLLLDYIFETVKNIKNN